MVLFHSKFLALLLRQACFKHKLVGGSQAGGGQDVQRLRSALEIINSMLQMFVTDLKAEGVKVGYACLSIMKG